MANDADLRLELGQQLARTQRRVVRDRDRTLWKELGYRASGIDVLMALTATPEAGHQMFDLAAQLGVPPGALRRLTDRIANAGFIRRERNPTDRRRMRIIITPRGRRELRRAIPHYREAIRQTGLGSLTATEARALQRLLVKVGG